MNERGQKTHDQGEQVKIPLLPNKVGKRSGTMVMTQCKFQYMFSQQNKKIKKCLKQVLLLD